MAEKDHIKLDLEVLTARLNGVRAVVMTAVTALETQRADRDDDIALALMRGAADPLADVVKKLDLLTTRLPANAEGGAQ